MTRKARNALRIGALGALFGLVVVGVDIYNVEQHNAHVLGYLAWPDLSSTVSFAALTAAASAAGFIAFFVVAFIAFSLLRRAS